jgi:phytoene dehydrogenase-like protein
MHTRTSGYPIGGSLEFARGIEKRFLDLGGEIRYRARVQKILTESGRAVGVRLADGSEHRADMVISAADGHATIFEMLEGKYLSDEIRGYYDRLPKFGALIQVSLGIARDLSAEPAFTLNLAEKPMEVAGEKIEVMPVHIYSYDPTLAPPGKSVVVARFFGDYRRWKELKKNPEAYEAEKQKLGDFMIGYMESRYPGISEQVEMVDVATPTTFERYTGNWEGSMEGWLLTTKSLMMKMKRTLPGLQNFYMIGQWVVPGGGLPTGAMTGREAIQVLCHHDGKEFRASAP